MATLTVRDIDEADYENLQLIARKNNRSTAAQIRGMLTDLCKRQEQAEKVIEELGEFRKRSNWTLPKGMTSLDLLREERNSW